MTRRPAHLFLFDLDGTLVSTGGAGLRALAKTFRSLHNVENVLDRVDPSGKTDPAIFREIFTTCLNRDMDGSDQKCVTDAYLSHLENEVRHSLQYRVLPGVIEILDYLSALSDVMVGLGTGNLETGARIKLEPAGLNRYFKFGGFGSDAEDRAAVLKIGYERAAAICGTKIDPACVYVVGDTELDIRAAKRVGFQSLAVATGSRTQAELLSAQPDYILSTLNEGLEFFRRVCHQCEVPS